MPHPWKILFGLLICLLAADETLAETEPGTCVEYRFSLKDDGQSTDSVLPLRVVRHGAMVYHDAAGMHDVPDQTLSFGAKLYATQISLSATTGLIKVRLIGTQEEIGWMKREDLLCRVRPLKNRKGLERKLFVKTPAMLRDERLAVPAYDSPDADRCLSDTCLELSRFEMRFIFATAWHERRGEKKLRYLVAEYASLEELPRLTGWVDAENVIPWDTALGLRPRIGAGRLEILPRTGDQELADVLQTGNPDEGIALEGGNQWFRFDKRIALLDREALNGREYYRVAFPGVGVEALAADQDIEKARKLKRVDVFFLIDGTRSMSDFIRAAQRAAVQIAQRLTSAPGFEETYFRYGFRVYRDSYAGGDGTGEGLPLDKSADSCGNDRGRSQLYFDTFQTRIQEVTATEGSEDDKDEFPESLFNGLRRAVADMDSCQDHWKLLFVIGDAGDNQQAVSQDVITDLLGYRQIVPFFIRARHGRTDPDAYQRFVDQGRAILRGVLPGTSALAEEAIDVDRYLLDLTDSDLAEQVPLRVANYGSSNRANDVILALRSGQPLDQILRGLMRQDRENDEDFPILYWQRVRDLICGDNETRCTQRVTHNVMEGYVEVGDDWVEELWMPEADLDKWLALLLPLSKLEGKPPSEMKQEFVDVLVSKLEALLGPPEIALTGESIQDFLLRRGRLPSRTLSPLMQYEPQEILDVTNCELTRLVLWAKQIRVILLRASADSTIRVSFDLEPYPEGSCPLISDKGKALQRIVLENSRDELGDSDEYRYSHTYLGETRYWLPKEFLP